MSHAVVVGARNLGGSIADRLLADGWDGSAIVRSADTASAARDRGCAAHQADAVDVAQLRAALDAATAQSGPIDLMVNAVSVARFDPAVPFGGGRLDEATLERFEAWSAAVTRQAFVLLAEAARRLPAQGHPATVVQIANRSSRETVGGLGLWAAGWHGVRALTMAAAHELREQGIHVALLIVDGPIASPKTAAMLADVPADATIAQDDVALAVAQLATQPARGHTHELTLTPAGRPPAPW